MTNPFDFFAVDLIVVLSFAIVFCPSIKMNSICNNDFFTKNCCFFSLKKSLFVQFVDGTKPIS